MMKKSREALTTLRTASPQHSRSNSNSRANSNRSNRGATPRSNSARRATGGPPAAAPLAAKAPSAAVPAVKEKAKAKPKEKKSRASSVGRRSSKNASSASDKLQVEPAVRAATKLQKRWRAVRAQRSARADLDMLREFDLLMAQVRLENLQRRAERLAAQLRADAAIRLQCAARRRLGRRAFYGRAATRLQCAVRQKLARKASHDAYWAYAYGLLDDDSATRIQQWWRTRRARRDAQEGLHLLREWDALLMDVRSQCIRRQVAATRIQRASRHHLCERWVDAMSGGVFAREAETGKFGNDGVGVSSADNPFSEAFAGRQEHRRRVEAEHGKATPGGTMKLRKHGKIAIGAMAHALPGQLATLYNTLRFVDAVNALISRRVVEVSESVEGSGSFDTAQYESLMAWGDKALQSRFGGCTQYLKAAKKFKFLHYRGEMLHEGTSKRAVLQSSSLGLSREELLARALQQPERVVPALYDADVDGPSIKGGVGGGKDGGSTGNELAYGLARMKLARLVLSAAPFRPALLDFLNGSFEADLRECACLLDDEFWPDSGGEESEDDENDKSLKRLADEAAVERVLQAHDFFDVLALKRDCSSADVKKAFIKLSKTVHPDKNGAKGANQAFDRLNSAKLTLSDASERAAYASAHPPRAAAAREWARTMDAATGKAVWRQG